MMKFLLSFCLLFAICLTGHSQPHAYDSKIEYQKTQQSVAAIDLPYSTDLVEDAIKEYMGGRGQKGSSLRGFTVYRGAKLDESGGDLNDLHFKVEKKNRDRNTSTIYLLVAKPSEDPASRAPGTDISLDKAKEFLDRLVPAVEAHHLDLQIKDQEEVVKKAQKKRNSLSDDQASLEKKIRNAQSDLDQNKKDQVTQAQTVQASLSSSDDAAKKKAQKKMNGLIDDQSDLEKKIRKNQASLDENKRDQESQQKELEKQQQTLESMKSRRK